MAGAQQASADEWGWAAPARLLAPRQGQLAGKPRTPAADCSLQAEAALAPEAGISRCPELPPLTTGVHDPFPFSHPRPRICPLVPSQAQGLTPTSIAARQPGLPGAEEA